MCSSCRINVEPEVFAINRREHKRDELSILDPLPAIRVELSHAVISSDVDKLTELLDRAEHAHAADPEGERGKHDWARWYAEYLLGVR